MRLSWFLKPLKRKKKKKQTDKPLARLTKKRRNKTKISRNKRGNITTDTGQIHTIITNY